eukprot:9357338-Ditylum_brightwellii.AAC.1
MSLRTPVAHPVKMHVYCSRASLFHSFVGDSTCCGVVSEDRCGWLGCPISVRARHNSSPFLVLEYSAPISASAIKAMTLRITLQTMWISPLSETGSVGGLLGSWDEVLRKKCPPARLRACVSNIKEVSE